MDPAEFGDTILRQRTARPDLDLFAGDSLIVRARDTAEPGQIVVCVDSAGNVSPRRFEPGQAEGVIGLVTWVCRRFA
jgi:hypothetical protein